MGKVLISAQNLSIGYKKGKQRSVLFKDISFDLFSGELTCLLGHNGVGKSTLLRTICAMQPALAGNIKIAGKNLPEYSEEELSRILGLVLTDKTTAGGLTVRELVSLGRYPYTGFWGRLNNEDKEIINRAMQDVAIEHKAHNYVSELSDGERQKALIAKALAQQCPIVLLDEPTAFLDVTSRIEVMKLLHLLSNQGKAILLSTHDIESALVLADRLWLLSDTDGLVAGVTEEIIFSEKMTHFFKEKNIFFEKKSGRFLPKLNVQQNVHLVAENDLYYWTKNLLNRNGFYVDKEKEYSFSVEVISENNIVLENISGESKNVSSFEDLVGILKCIAQKD